MMAPFITIIILIVLLSSCSADFVINQHTCEVMRLQPDGWKLRCEYKGKGQYHVDRVIKGVRVIEFPSFDKGIIYTANESLPDLVKISISKTDLSVPEMCENVHTNNEDVHVYVSGQKCHVTVTETSSTNTITLRLTPPSSSKTNDELEDPTDSTTFLYTTHFGILTSSNGLDIVTLIIIIVSAVTLLLFVCLFVAWRKRSARRQPNIVNIESESSVVQFELTKRD